MHSFDMGSTSSPIIEESNIHSVDMSSTSLQLIEESNIHPVDVEYSTSSLPTKENLEKSSIKREESREDEYQNVVTSMNAKMTTFSSRFHRNFFLPIGIYKVPEKLRKGKEDSFVPRMVSIGPYHRGASNLQGMEVFKWRCLQRFQSKFGKAAVDHIIVNIMHREIEIRDCYETSFDEISSEHFAEMMMLDGIFILELMAEISTYAGSQIREMTLVDARIFEHEWMTSEILHDMLLLENQLPWFVLSLCLTHAHKQDKWGGHDCGLQLGTFFDILTSVIVYFQGVGITCPPELILTQPTYSNFLEILWISVLPKSPRRRPRRRGKPEYTRSATELKDVGVKFRKREGRPTTDIHFDFRKGELEIPPLNVNEWTQTFFRNLIALEQCQCGGKPKIVASYIIFMDLLIDTSSDVDILIKHGILENSLGDSQQVADLFNNLHKETLLENENFFFTRQCEELNEYSRDYLLQCNAKFLKWGRMLARDYFGNPWTTISVIAACILLALTIIQTYCSVTAL